MVISFLDLLGFSWLMEYDLKTAYYNLDFFNRIINTKISDEKCHPKESYELNMQEFVENTSITSFNNMISISDSLIISSDNPNIFVKQLSNFVACSFIESNEPFRDVFDDIKKVKYEYEYSHESKSVERKKVCAFPLLFRGGISIGEVIFSSEIQIINNEAKRNGLNVCGIPYLEAVKLENSGKGPRLFCNNSFVNSLNSDSKKAIRLVGKIKNEEIYEIVWTYYAFEAMENCSNKIENIQRCLNRTVLPPAINLYNYFKDDENNRLHYFELVKLIFRGAIKYANDNIENDIHTLEILKSKINDLKIHEELFDVTDFVE